MGGGEEECPIPSRGRQQLREGDGVEEVGWGEEGECHLSLKDCVFRSRPLTLQTTSAEAAPTPVKGIESGGGGEEQPLGVHGGRGGGGRGC